MPASVFRPDELNDWLGQGDLFEGVNTDGTAASMLGTPIYWLLVLDHECQIAKELSTGVICTAAFVLANLDSGNQGHIRSGRVHHTMYLPSGSDRPELYVDFRYQARMPIERLRRAMTEGTRRASMTAEGRLALQESVYRYYARSLHRPTGES